MPSKPDMRRSPGVEDPTEARFIRAARRMRQEYGEPPPAQPLTTDVPPAVIPPGESLEAERERERRRIGPEYVYTARSMRQAYDDRPCARRAERTRTVRELPAQREQRARPA